LISRNFHNNHYLEDAKHLDYENNFLVIYYKQIILTCFANYIRDSRTIRSVSYHDLIHQPFFVNLFEYKFSQQLHNLVKQLMKHLMKPAVMLNEEEALWAISIDLNSFRDCLLRFMSNLDEGQFGMLKEVAGRLQPIIRDFKNKKYLTEIDNAMTQLLIDNQIKDLKTEVDGIVSQYN
jgi:hypothetical protein